jgi:hypothetical protein
MCVFGQRRCELTPKLVSLEGGLVYHKITV